MGIGYRQEFVFGLLNNVLQLFGILIGTTKVVSGEIYHMSIPAGPSNLIISILQNGYRIRSRPGNSTRAKKYLIADFAKVR